MHCFVCGDADAEYDLTAPDYAEFFAEQIPTAAAESPPSPAPTTQGRKIHLCNFCRESLEDHDEPEAIEDRISIAISRELARLDSSCACPLDALCGCELGDPCRCDAEQLPHRFQRQANGRLYCPDAT